MSVGQEKVAIALIVLAAHIAGLTLVVSAGDYGQYEDVPQHIRDWPARTLGATDPPGVRSASRRGWPRRA